MKNRFFIIVSLTAGLTAPFAFSTPASQAFSIGGAGSVEFHALGRPAMLKIVGKGVAPQGDLVVTKENAISGKLTLPLDSLDTGIKLRNEHMRDKYLEVAKHPAAELTLDPVPLPELAAAADFKKEKIPFKGKLKLHGEEKPIDGTADIARAAGKLNVKADFTIKTSDFKIETPKYMGITVAEDVKVAVNLDAHPK